MKNKLLLLFLSCALCGAGVGGEADRLRDKGFELLKAAQTDPNKIVEAARVLTDASAVYQRDGDDRGAQEMESYLFWAKKKMTVQQIDTFLARGGETARRVVEKMEAVEKKEVKPEEVALYLAKADGYAEGSRDPFLIAVRYFEVASRFKGTPDGDKALERSLAALQKAKPLQAASGVAAGVASGKAKSSAPFIITKATYGFADKSRDITKYVSEKSQSGSFNFNEARLCALVGDPAFGVVKKVVIEYRKDGQLFKETLINGDTLDFSTGQVQ